MLLAALFNVSMLVTFPLLVAAGAVQHLLNVKFGVCFFDALAPEVWLPILMENPYPNASFLQAATDLSGLVDNDSINLAEAGADPDVLVNNTTYPIPETDAGDNPLRITLNTYDTTSTVVRNAIAVELKYDQRAYYVNKHKKSLAKKMGIDAAYLYAPAANDDSRFNKIIGLAANDSVIDGIIDMQVAYATYDADSEDLNMVLDPIHMGMIAKEDKVLYKAIQAKPGEVFYGFKTWTYSKNPFYLSANNTKAAKGAAFVDGTHKRSTFFFAGSEVMSCLGTYDMFSLLKSPAHKGDVFNFQVRALAQTLRNKFQGALLK